MFIVVLFDPLAEFLDLCPSKVKKQASWHSRILGCFASFHCTTRVQAFESEPASQPRSTPPPAPASLIDTAPALDAESTSLSLGYTWLTHWNLIEEDRQFRQHVFQSTRGRQVQRNRQLLDLLSLSDTGSSEITKPYSRENNDEAEVCIINGRLSVFSPPSTETLNEHDMAELMWIASHLVDGASHPENLGVTWEETSSSESDAIHKERLWSRNTSESEKILPGSVQLRVGNEMVNVRPLWISVYVEESAGVAKLFESVVPIQTEIMDRISVDLTPFYSVTGMDFGSQADLCFGPWVNYFVGLVGDVAADDADILWPNQLQHRDRVLYNVRNADDVARFLADPRRADVEGHLENLQRLAAERGYRKGWCWYMLRTRWGEKLLQDLKIDCV